MYYHVTQNKLNTFKSYWGGYKANIRQPLKRGQPPKRGQRPRSQSVLCSEVLLYLHLWSRKTSHNRIKDTVDTNFTEFWLFKLHTNAFAVMLCSFKILTTPTHKQAIMALSKWPPVQTEKNVSLLGMVVRRLSPFMQRERPTQCQPRSFYAKLCCSHAIFTLQGNPSIPLSVPPFLLT